MKLSRLIPLAAMAPLAVLAACKQETKAPEAENAQTVAPDAKPGIAASDGVLMLPAVKGNPGGAYFTVVNTAGKDVTLAAVSIDGAGKTEMHDMRNGEMTPTTNVDIKNGETVKFERGGRHVMAFDLSDAVAAGGTVEMTLTFADGDKVSAPLKVEAAGGAMNHGGAH
ncbi:MAG: copper chaperone PCu(A)C [Novosphingobium sp.]